MDPTSLSYLIGPVLGAFFGLGTFMLKKNLERTDKHIQNLYSKVEVIKDNHVADGKDLSVRFVPRTELEAHERSDQLWHNLMAAQVDDLKEDVLELKMNVTDVRLKIDDSTILIHELKDAFMKWRFEDIKDA